MGAGGTALGSSLFFVVGWFLGSMSAVEAVQFAICRGCFGGMCFPVLVLAGRPLAWMGFVSSAGLYRHFSSRMVQLAR